MFSLAHISDPHLAPLPHASFGQLASKRIFGWANWHFNGRKTIHDTKVLNKVTAHLKAAQCDHIAVTGDLVNIALPSEFEHAAQWLQSLGAPNTISLVPGNHDAYVPVKRPKATGLWSAYMQGDNKEVSFPYFRKRGAIAIIGMSSSVPSMPLQAIGAVSALQYTQAANMLDQAQQAGLARVILIHHPPLQGLSPKHKRLLDAARFEKLMQDHGAELVLHGHLHKSMINHFQGKHGMVPVVGVTSASSSGHNNREMGGWNAYQFSPKPTGGFDITLVQHRLDNSGVMHSQPPLRLSA